MGDTQFGRYLHRWDAEAVARALRREGHKTSVKQLHATCFTVVLK